MIAFTPSKDYVKGKGKILYITFCNAAKAFEFDLKLFSINHPTSTNSKMKRV
jgi:hypothetical protein